MKTVLVLEDDDSSRCLLEAVLEGEYRVVVTDSPEDAVRVCESEPPDLFVSDNQLRSPISGLQTLCRVHESHPQLPLLIVSGTPPEGWLDGDFECFAKLVNSARLSFLQKPFKGEAIRKEAADLLKAASSSPEIRIVYANAAKHRASEESWRVRFRS